MSTWYVIPSNSDILHYGKKGMKWGVRNDPQPKGRGVRIGKPASKTGSSYSSSHKSGSSSSNIKKTGTSNAPLNNFGGAALAGGASVKDMEEMQALYEKLNSGKQLTDAEIAVFQRVLAAMSKGNKQAYEQFLNNNPKIYKIVNSGVTNASSSGPNRGGWSKSNEILRRNGSRVDIAVDPIGVNMGLVGAASRTIERRNRTRSGGSGGRF